MPRKKVDNRIRVLVENGLALRQRTMFVVVGDKGRDQVVILHHMLCKSSLKARPSVLWCYKKELGFSTHRKKRMRQLQRKMKAGGVGMNEDDPFELFVAATTIRYCYYSEAHKIMGNTYGMCVLQDFEALTPNLLARTVETVEGGGVIVILLRSMASLKQLYTMTMDVHSRYRTEARQDVVARFNERFLLSLASCSHSIVMDDQFNVLPISTHVSSLKPVDEKTTEYGDSSELSSMKESMTDTQPVGSLVSCTRTVDQAKALLVFVEAISEKTLRSTVTLTAGRGRGKSAALGLAIAAGVAFGYANIFVTSPSPENLNTLFEFVLKGFDVLGYTEHQDYELVQSTNPEFGKAIVRVNVFHEHRQTVQYIHPSDSHKLGQAELVCIDEAAAIPLPLVKKLLGPYLVFMASTVNGYEGTGRSLSLKLFQQLREQSISGTGTAGRVLKEVTLEEPIRYAAGDPIESWLHNLLCLDATKLPRIISGCPPPHDCELYLVNRDTLFCYHKASEQFLQKIMALFVASHYKNTPNDLQLLSDAPAHQIFVLLPPVGADQSSLPDVLCIMQVCLEGDISKDSVMKSLSRGKRASGDLIPWTISQQFADHSFATLSGARIVRIAAHPDLQRMGYGSRALQLLVDYYEGKMTNLTEEAPPTTTTITTVNDPQMTEEGLLTEQIAPRSSLPPLLTRLSERPAEHLDYVGVSYGLTHQLLRFWKRGGFLPVYLRQTSNELTGEHSCIMLRTLASSEADQGWLQAYHKDFKQRFLSLLSYQFRDFPAQQALAVVHHKTSGKADPVVQLTIQELKFTFTQYDMKRLELYSRNMADHHLITDLLPALARLYFTQKTNFTLSAVQAAILLGMGLQHKPVETLERESELPASQIMGLYNRIIRKFVQQLSALQEDEVTQTLADPSLPPTMTPVPQTLDEELSTAAEEIKQKQLEQRKQLENMDFSEFAVSGKEADWEEALSSGKGPGIVSIARGPKRKKHNEQSDDGPPSKHAAHTKKKPNKQKRVKHIKR